MNKKLVKILCNGHIKKYELILNNFNHQGGS